MIVYCLLFRYLPADLNHYIWLDDLMCNSSSTDIRLCTPKGVNDVNCLIESELGISCVGGT